RRPKNARRARQVGAAERRAVRSRSRSPPVLRAREPPSTSPASRFEARGSRKRRRGKRQEIGEEGGRVGEEEGADAQKEIEARGVQAALVAGEHLAANAEAIREVALRQTGADPQPVDPLPEGAREGGGLAFVLLLELPASHFMSIHEPGG